MTVHRVRFEPQGRIVKVREDERVLDAALAAGLNLPHSCKSGHCASCRARLLSGEIRYPGPMPLGITEAEAADGNVLLCQASPRSDLVVEARVIRSVTDVEIRTLPCRIERKQRLAPDVLQLFLRLPAVERLDFKPGQYLDVLLEGGRRRSFSIASPPHDAERLELHVRRVPGGGFTELLFEREQAGELLRIEGPVGQFTYLPSTAPAILIAGGTGFAPMKSILRHVLERGVAARELHFYWGAQRRIDLYEELLVREWTRQYPHFHFKGVLSVEATPPGTDLAAGWVHEAVLADHADLSAFDVYVAGPPALIEAIRASYPARGLDAARLHFDSFDFAPR